MYLEQRITRNVYTDICRGLFESHKRIFSFLICTRIKRQAGLISNVAWNLLLRGGSPQTETTPNPDKIFLKEQQWLFVQACSESIHELAGMAQDIKNNLVYWKEFLTLEDLYT
jgi:dynein heavy chain, axonemal